MAEIIHRELSYLITGLCFRVHRELGRFCRERQYADRLEQLLRENGVGYEREYRVERLREEAPDGNRVDFLIEGKVVVELKAKRFLTKDDYYQMQRYLHAAHLKLGLLINFRGLYVKPKRVLNADASDTDSRHSHAFAYSHRPSGFSLIELLVVLGVVTVALTLIGSVAANARGLRRTAERGHAQAVADAVVAAARALPADRIADQDAAEPRGVILETGTWAVRDGAVALDALDGDGRGVLPVPGDVRGDGTIAITLDQPPDPDWTLDVLARAEDLRNGYVLRLSANRAEILTLAQGAATSLAAIARSGPPRAVRFSLAGTALRAELDADALTASSGAYANGWFAISARSPVSLRDLSWTDSGGTTRWELGAGPDLPSAWLTVATTPLRRAHAALTIRNATSGPPGLKELAARVTWDGIIGPDTVEERTWASFE